MLDNVYAPLWFLDFLNEEGEGDLVDPESELCKRLPQVLAKARKKMMGIKGQAPAAREQRYNDRERLRVNTLDAGVSNPLYGQ